MIDFPCRCGYPFSIPEDLAGGLVQCPACRLLVDVPMTTQVKDLEPDGTIKLGPPLPPEPGRLKELDRAFNPSHVDDHGVEYDLRSTIEQVARAGDGHERQRHPAASDAPRYDPETGELIRPLDLAPVHAVPVVPPRPQDDGRTISYARALPRGSQLGVRRYPLVIALLVGGNGAVLLMLFFAHLLTNLVMLAVLKGLLFAAIFPLSILVGVMAHYANVVEDTGILEQDELPPLLRYAQWREDIWNPLLSTFFSLLICFGPALVLFVQFRNPIVVLPLLLGTLFFPAIFLTLTSSGSILNLRPDRVMGVVGHCGLRYIISVILAGLALAAYVPAAVLSAMLPAVPAGVLPIGSTAACYLLLIIGIYLAHLFCWHLGTLYRRYHEQFPWILQRYRPKGAAPIERRRPRYLQQKPRAPGQQDPPDQQGPLRRPV
jgi:hypothetical protein